MSVRCGCWKPSAPHEATCAVVREEQRLFERLMTAASPRDHTAAPGRAELGRDQSDEGWSQAELREAYGR